MTKATKLLTALPPPQRARLMALAQEVSFAEDTRIFEPGGRPTASGSSARARSPSTRR